jgi:hypothetical protein
VKIGLAGDGSNVNWGGCGDDNPSHQCGVPLAIAINSVRILPEKRGTRPGRDPCPIHTQTHVKNFIVLDVIPLVIHLHFKHLFHPDQLAIG